MQLKVYMIHRIFVKVTIIVYIEQDKLPKTVQIST